MTGAGLDVGYFPNHLLCKFMVGSISVAPPVLYFDRLMMLATAYTRCALQAQLSMRHILSQ